MFCLSICAYAQPGLTEEGFEGTWTTQTGSGAGGPAGWALISEANGPTVWWIQGNGGAAQPAFEGTHSAFLDRENVAPGTVARDWLITPLIEMPTNPQLHFYSRLFFNADQGSVFKIYVSNPVAEADDSVANQTNIANFGTAQVTWTEVQINPTQQAWAEKTLDLPATMAGSFRYIAFVMEGDNAERWAIDNVKVTAKCQDPSALTATGITTTTANLSWANPSGATSWEIEVIPVSGNPTGTGVTYTGALPFPAGTAGSGVTLTENTDYKYYVKALCSDGGESIWVGPFNFSTTAVGEACGSPIVVASVPYSTTDNTSNYGDTVENSPGATGCGTTSPYLNGNDVFYAYTPTTTGVISIDVTNNGAWAGVFVYNSCANVGVSCIGGASSSSAVPLSIPSLTVTANTTYYIVISTWATPQTTPYTLTIQQVNCAPPVGLPTTGATATSANLSWSNPSTATSWQLVVQNPGAGIPTGAGTTATTNTNYNVSATTPGGVAFTSATTYEYYVRADCGNGTFSAWAGPYTFMTTQVPATLNYTQDFETTPTGWSLSNGNQPNQWHVGTATSNGGTHSLYISNTGGVTNAYNNSQASVVHAYRDFAIPAGADQTNLSFDWKNLGETGWDYIRVWQVPAGFAPTVGQQITEAADRIMVAGPLVGNSNWTTVNTILTTTPYINGTMRLVFEWRDDTSGGSNPPAAIDNINLSVITCSQPTALTIGTLTDSAVTYNWTGPSGGAESYDVYWSTTNTAPTASTTPITTVATTTYTQTPLIPSTTYYFWVRSNCGTDDGLSLWTGPVSFTTPQIPAVTDYVQDFEGTDNGNWTLNNGTQTNKWFIGSATSLSPTQSLYVSNTNGTTNAYDTGANSVVQAYRDIAIPAGTTDANLAFSWKNQGENFWDYIRVWLVPTTFTPTAGTQIVAGPNRIQIGDNLSGNANWTNVSVVQNVSSYAGATMRLVFEWRNDGGGGTQPPAAIDNVNFSVITCPQPTALTVNGVTETQAILGWTNQGTASAWEVYVVPSTQPAPTASTVGTVVTTPPPYTITTLQAATQYNYYVRAICADDDKSLWSGPIVFNTPICDPSLQCNYSFVMTDSFGDGWNGNTMTVSQNGIPVATIGSTFTTGVGPVTVQVPLCNGVPFELYWNAGGSFAGEVGVSIINPFTQTLYTKPSGTGTQNSLLFVGEADCLNPACLPPTNVVITDETTTTIDVEWAPSVVVGATYEVYYTLQGGDAPGETPTTNVITTTTPNAVIEELTASTVYDIYVRTICSATSNSTWAGPFAHETDPLCPEPLDLSVTCLSNTGAAFDWAADGTETSWEVVVLPATDPMPTSGTVVTSPSYAVDNLSANTAYTVYVRAVCPDVDGFSSWAEQDFTTNVGPGDAQPFCAGDSGIPVVNNSTQPAGSPGYGQIGCLFTTPNAIWYYLTVDAPGNLNFTLTQVSNTGTPIDVDFAAFGPFTSELDACSQIDLTPGPTNPLIVACSYSASATEIFSLSNAQTDQVYAILITNFNSQPGTITLTQTNINAPGAGSTSCDITVDLGLDQILCATDEADITANIGNPTDVTGFTYTWFMDGVEIAEPDVVETDDESETIHVTELGTHVYSVVVTYPNQPANESITDQFTVALSPVFVAETPAPVTLCSATGTSPITIDYADLLGTLNPADYEVVGVYTSQANANANISPIADGTVFTATNQTLYVVVADSNVLACKQTVLWVITVTAAPTATIAYSGPYCTSSATNTATVTLTGSAGGVYTSTTGLAIDAATGTINLADSDAGTYTVTYAIAASSSCPAFTTTTTVEIIEAAQAEINYGTPVSTTLCSNAGTVQPVVNGTQGGTYSADNGLAIDPVTGEINATTATSGTYIITYTLPASGPCAAVTATTEVVITTQPVAAISYANSPYCSDAGTATVTQTGVLGGVYSADGAVVINATTGEIDLAASTGGTYTITYTVAAAGGCDQVIATTQVVITTLPVAGFSYGFASVCQNAQNVTAVLNTGGTAGVFTVDVPGLTIDPVTGTITPGTSTVGTYIVTNTIAAAGGCGEIVASVTVNILPAPVPTFSYAAVAYCQDETTNPSPILTDAAGTFTASPAGLVIDGATGIVNLAASTPGTYTVSNTVAGTTDCPSVTASTTITVTALPVVTVIQGCIDNNYTLTVSFEQDLRYNADNVSFEWTNSAGTVVGTDASTLVVTNTEPETYFVTVTPLTGDCSATAEAFVDSASCMVQKGISPNGDGLNDNFDLSGFDIKKLEIFNRYGKEVYSKNMYTDEWFGQTNSGDELPTGTYFFMFERANGETKTGWIYINRQD